MLPVGYCNVLQMYVKYQDVKENQVDCVMYLSLVLSPYETLTSSYM